MKIPASISFVLAILGIVLMLNGTIQKSNDTVKREINGAKVELVNSKAIGLNMRHFIGFVCILGSVIAGIAGAGKNTVVMGGIQPED